MLLSLPPAEALKRAHSTKLQQSDHVRPASSPGLTQAVQPLTTAKKKLYLKRGLSKKLCGFAKNFWRYDTDGSGEIEPDEFAAVLRAFQLPFSDDEEVVVSVFEDMDFDGSGAISLAEVVRYALLDILQKSKDRIYNLCKLWDYDNSDTVNRDEFGRVIEALQLEVPVVAVDALFKDLDDERTGELVYEEFIKKLDPRQQPSTPRQQRPDNLLRVASSVNRFTDRLKRSSAQPEGHPSLPVRSSSHPPSEVDSDSDPEDQMTPRTTRADGAELMQYMSSTTKLQEAEAQHALLNDQRAAATAHQAMALMLLARYEQQTGVDEGMMVPTRLIGRPITSDADLRVGFH